MLKILQSTPVDRKHRVPLGSVCRVVQLLTHTLAYIHPGTCINRVGGMSPSAVLHSTLACDNIRGTQHGQGTETGIHYIGDLPAERYRTIVKITAMIDATKQMDDETFRLLSRKIAEVCDGAAIKCLESFSVFRLEIGGDAYAIKQILKCDSNDMVAAEFDSEYVVKVHLAFSKQVGGRMVQWLVTECLDGSVTDMIAEKHSTEDVRRLAHDVLCGVAHIHSRRYLHRDMQTDNVMWVRDPGSEKIAGYKIIDFGTAQRMEHGLDMSDLREDLQAILVAIRHHLRGESKEEETKCTMRGRISRAELVAVEGLRDLIDFYFVANGDCEHPPKTASDLLHHPFITGKRPVVGSDEFGRRFYGVVVE